MTEGRELERNAIIETLPYKEARRFETLCHKFALEKDDVLHEPNQDLKAVYFPTSGVISLAITGDKYPSLELGKIGRDGMLGATLSLGIHTEPKRAVVQIAGNALTMASAQFQRELRTNSHLLKSVRYFQLRLMMQAEHAAVCLNAHPLEPRLARWLLMTRDLSHSDTFHLTHEHLANALGVRRSEVTLAVGSLHRQGMIKHSDGKFRILDHPGLESAACDCHATLTNRYQKVSGIS